MKYLIILLLILGAAVGIYYWNGSQNTVNTRYQDEGTGISFKYDTENYVVLEQAPSEATPDLIKTYVIFEKTDYQSVLNGEREGGEGPASISLQVYRNPLKQDPLLWARTNANISNIQLIMGPTKDETIADLPAVTYTADGLYASRNAVIKGADRIYFASGQYLDQESNLYREFDDFLASLEINK